MGGEEIDIVVAINKTLYFDCRQLAQVIQYKVSIPMIGKRPSRCRSRSFSMSGLFGLFRLGKVVGPFWTSIAPMTPLPGYKGGTIR